MYIRGFVYIDIKFTLSLFFKYICFAFKCVLGSRGRLGTAAADHVVQEQREDTDILLLEAHVEKTG